MTAPLRAPGRSADLRWTIGLQRELLRDRGLIGFARWNAMLAAAWARDRTVGRRRYPRLDEDQVRAARRSDTVFVFGSGYSLNDLAEPEWEAIAEHDTFGFNAFYNQDWVRTDFQLLRGGVYGELRWRVHAAEVSRRLRANPRFAGTIYLLQEDYLGHFANQLVGHGLLPSGSRVFRYRTARAPGLPTRSFAEGVRHLHGTLADAVNCAYLLGWREIVLAGVDLYDSRYFFLGPEETLAFDPQRGTLVPAEASNIRGNRYDEPHNTAASGVVEQMAEWGRALEREGVRLSVLNPRSLLAGPLPVHRLPVPAAR